MLYSGIHNLSCLIYMKINQCLHVVKIKCIKFYIGHLNDQFVLVIYSLQLFFGHFCFVLSNWSGKLQFKLFGLNCIVGNCPSKSIINCCTGYVWWFIPLHDYCSRVLDNRLANLNLTLCVFVCLAIDFLSIYMRWTL